MLSRRERGFTLPEVLIALAVIAVAMGSLVLAQVNNLRASVSSRAATETKAAANLVLEDLTARVLERTGTGDSADDFDFYHHYWTCPSAATPPDPTAPAVDGSRATCSGGLVVADGTSVLDADAEPGGGTTNVVDVVFSIAGEPGVLGEGVVTITVTATHRFGGQRLTLGDRITCYDVFPSPTATAPEPCPIPITAGGGRP